VGLMKTAAWAGGGVSFLSVAALCGSLAAARVKTGRQHPGEASCIGGQAREATVECGVGEDDGRRRWLGVGFLGASVGL
jgi:hypothetical protein